MRILLIGGTGVLGRVFCRQASQRKHEVIALSRSREKSDLLESMGATPVMGSILEPDSIKHIVARHQIILNLASAVPHKLKPSANDWHLNDIVRVQSAANILQSLPQQDVFYCQSSLSFVYGDHGGAWVDETSPIQPNRFTKSARVAEELFLTASHPSLRGISFRFSLFYHQDSWHTGTMIHEVSKRRFPILGEGDYYWNFVHVEDAASALLTVVENQDKISGRQVMNVVDDTPVLCRDFLDFLAGLLRVHPPTRIPLFVARLALGTDLVSSVTASVRCRNHLLRSTGWRPMYSSYREGLPQVLQIP